MFIPSAAVSSDAVYKMADDANEIEYIQQKGKESATQISK